MNEFEHPQTQPGSREDRTRIWKRAAMIVCLAFAVGFASADPAAAQELQPLEDMADKILDFLTGVFARSMAIISLAVLGIIAFFGVLSWRNVGYVLLGLVLVFGGAELVDTFSDLF